MIVEQLSTELERLYDQGELEALSRDLLGFEPPNSQSGKSAIARALAQRCVEQDAVAALLDAVAASRQKRLVVPPPPPSVPGVPPGDSAVFEIRDELGKGPSARVCRATVNGRDCRVKLVEGVPRRDVQRYLVATRLVASVNHAGLPANVRAGAVLGDGVGVLHDYFEGETLAQLLKRTGPRHFNELLSLLWAIGEPLAALHEAGLCHGSLHLNNVLVREASTSSPKVLLLDAGSHLLRPAVPCEEGDFTRSYLVAIAPEQLKSGEATPQSDVYAFGVILYQLLTGKDPYIGKSAADLVVAHLTETPEPLSLSAPRGIAPDVERFVGELLEIEPEARPQNGAELMEALRRVWRTSTRPPSWVSDERLEGRFILLGEDPSNQELAAELESTVDLGADPARVAAGFENVVRVASERGQAVAAGALKGLLQRAARLYEAAGHFAEAARIYGRLCQEDPSDASSASAHVRLLRRLRKFEEAIEFLLTRAEQLDSQSQRAECFAEIGEIYERELKEPEQAAVAYVEAFVSEPSNELARAVERTASDQQKTWSEVLESAQASAAEAPEETRTAIWVKVAEWYATRLGRADLAVPVLTNALSLDPGNDAILGALADLYRKGQRWVELGQILVHRAEIAAPAVARELKSEAAEILATKLNNPAAAEELFEAVLAEDPGHGRAAEGMANLLRARGDNERALKVLEGRVKALTGDAKIRQCLELAEVYELELNKLEAAERLYRDALHEDPRHADALKGLDRVLNRLGRYQELVEVIERELEVAVTGRQRVALYERLAGLYDEEFLDPVKAAQALEKVLELDPQRVSAATELARHYRRSERYQELLELYERQFEFSQDDAHRVEVGLALARLLDERFGQPQAAAERLTKVLAIAEGHAGALAALAGLKARLGDAQSAIEAIEALAERAETPAEKADQHLRAAALLDEAGDVPGTIERLKRALDVYPEHPSAAKKLFAKYLESGNHAAAVELLEEQLSKTTGDHARARLAGQIAFVCHRHLRDDERASNMAQLALHLDATNLDGLRVLGRIAWSEDRFVEAAKRLEAVVAQLEGLPPDDAAETLFVYIDSLVNAGQSDRAISAIDAHFERLAESADALELASAVMFEHGPPSRTIEILERLLADHGAELGAAEETTARTRLGESLRKLGRHGEAIAELERASRLDPKARGPLSALAEVYLERGDAAAALEVRTRELELVQGERATLLLAMAEVAVSSLHDNDYAARCLLSALDERPNDRTILARLMQLYSTEKDWPRLIEVIERLAEVVTEPKQKAKYLHTASLVASRELGDEARSAELLARALEVDPENEAILNEAIERRRRLQDAEGLKELLKRKAAIVASQGEERRPLLLPVLEELGATYEALGNYTQAVRVYESALEVSPGEPRFIERVARVCAADPNATLEQTGPAFARWVELDPYRPEPYQLLRKVYTNARRADGAFLVCQALELLRQAQPDESRFFARFREAEPPQARRRLSMAEWIELVMPKDCEPLVGNLLTLLQPFVHAVRTRPLQSYGLGNEHLLDVSQYPHGLVFAFHYGSHVLPVQGPRVYQNPDDPSIVTLLSTTPPSVMLGARAFELGPTEAAFYAGRELVNMMPGFYLRSLLPNLTAIKAWMLAAMRLLKPKFPAPGDMEAPVEEALAVLRERATGEQRDHLLHSVRKLLEDGASLDLKRWLAAAEQAADRSGLALCHDLETACALIRAEEPRPGGIDAVTRCRDLLMYSVSPEYLALRERLGVNIDAG